MSPALFQCIDLVLRMKQPGLLQSTRDMQLLGLCNGWGRCDVMHDELASCLHEWMSFQRCDQTKLISDWHVAAMASGEAERAESYIHPRARSSPKFDQYNCLTVPLACYAGYHAVAMLTTCFVVALVLYQILQPAWVVG